METTTCPRCQAEGKFVVIIIDRGYGVCTRCETTWNTRKNGEMVAIPEEI